MTQQIERNPAVPEHLFSPCIGKPICYDRECAQMVKRNLDTGRWFITMGHCGFNSRINNCNGYETKNRARAAVKRYGGWRP
jgi:hypothetical protein